MPSQLPSRDQLIEKLIINFIKPGVKKIYFEELEELYQIIIVLDQNLHIIDNLMELEEVVTDAHEKVKFLYKGEWHTGELIWEEA